MVEQYLWLKGKEVLQKGSKLNVEASPKGYKEQTEHFTRPSKTAPKRNTHDDESSHEPNIKCSTIPATKPAVHASKSKETTPSAVGNTDQKKPLKPNRGPRSWNRMTENPPKSLLNDPDVRREA